MPYSQYRPSLRQLECAVAVAKHLSFRKAATECRITQPALSAQILQLERALGIRLFERDRRKVVLTSAGEALVMRARAALAEVDSFTDTARLLEGPLSGTLRLGVIPTVAPYVLPAALPPLRRAHPNLRLLLREDMTSSLVELLNNGELDLLLLAFETDLGSLVQRPLYRDPFFFAGPADHPFRLRKRIREQDLVSEAILLLADGHCLSEQALSICSLAGAQEIGDFRASSLNTLIRMVSCGIGVTLLPAMAIPFEVHAKDQLTLAPMVKRTHARTIGLAWRPTSAREEGFELLAQLFAKHRPQGVLAL